MGSTNFLWNGIQRGINTVLLICDEDDVNDGNGYDMASLSFASRVVPFEDADFKGFPHSSLCTCLDGLWSVLWHVRMNQSFDSPAC
jgi:hypothetical protein